MMFENKMLRNIFGPRRDEVTGEWRRLHHEKLYHLHFVPNITRVIQSGRIRWTGHVHVWRTAEVYTGFWWGNLREGDHLEDTGVVRRLILGWIFKKWGWGYGLD